jgi:DNA polymerase III subunit delta'
MLPWLALEFAALTQRRLENRFPHALLITGQPGVGKLHLAQALARVLLCERASAEGACGVCRGCALFAAGTHPDVRALFPPEGKRGIGIDQVRALSEFLVLKSQYAGYRVALIEPADAMNVNAANSLLKILEEPPAAAVLLLVSAQPSRLPATVRSRCQQLCLPVPPPQLAQAWLREQDGATGALECLELAGGAPLQAQRYAAAGWGESLEQMCAELAGLRSGASDPVSAAAAWSGRRDMAVEIVLLLVTQAIRAASGGSRGASRLRQPLEGLDLILLHDYLDKLMDARRLLAHPLNESLVLEQMFIDWCRVCRRSHPG